jgi:hypothetical protein
MPSNNEDLEDTTESDDELRRQLLDAQANVRRQLEIIGSPVGKAGIGWRGTDGVKAELEGELDQIEEGLRNLGVEPAAVDNADEPSESEVAESEVPEPELLEPEAPEPEVAEPDDILEAPALAAKPAFEWSQGAAVFASAAAATGGVVIRRERPWAMLAFGLVSLVVLAVVAIIHYGFGIALPDGHGGRTATPTAIAVALAVLAATFSAVALFGWTLFRAGDE